ncbi:MAG: acetylornithine deacetylase [Acidimicrobiia bacterium]
MSLKDDVQKVRSAVDPPELSQILVDLVRADSENPPGNEQRAAEVAAGWLERIGCSPIEFHAEIPGRPSVIAWWPRRHSDVSEKDRILALNGHLDVVPAGDPSAWTHPPFGGDIERGRIYGRGTSDMKSGIASMIEAVAAIERAQLALEGTICFQLVADEESAGTHGTQYLVREGYIRADAAIVGEPTSLMVGIGERGALWAKIKAFGRAAHGSVPNAGVSAIEKLSRAVLALHNRDFKKNDPLFGSPTLNVGVIAGGEKVNMVADYAEAQIDRRLVPGENWQSALEEIRQILNALTAEDPDARYEIEVMNFAEPSVESKDSRIVKVVAECITDCIGGPPEYYVSPGSSDARFLRNEARIPTILFGPGIMGLAHCVDEYVELDSMVAAAEVIAVAAHRFLSEKD